MPADTFAARLLAARRGAGLSVSELARRASLSRQQIGNYEAGRSEPTVSSLARLALALGCPVAYLVPISEKPVEIPIVQKSAQLERYPV